jgi:hypothetical protein
MSTPMITKEWIKSIRMAQSMTDRSAYIDKTLIYNDVK